MQSKDVKKRDLPLAGSKKRRFAQITAPEGHFQVESVQPNEYGLSSKRRKTNTLADHDLGVRQSVSLKKLHSLKI
jgi:hypothetical protein